MNHAEASPPIAALDPLPVHADGRFRALAGMLMGLGLLGLAWAGIGDHAGHGANQQVDNTSIAASGILAGMMLAAWVSIGALFFTAAHILGGAHWTVPLRRLIDGLSGGWPVVLVGAIVLAAWGAPHLYDWMQPGHGLFRTAAKTAWMSAPRWMLTTGAIILLFLALRTLLVRLSLRRDGGAEVGAGEVRLAIAALILGMPAFTLLVWDGLLALEAHFTSAIWGVYCLVGAVQTFLGVLVLVVVGMGNGALKGLIRSHIRHDLGTWMLAWGCVVAYITFAQYIIISFANIDEETFAILKRSQHGYGALYAAEAALRTLVPFALLMSQSLRTKPAVLALAALSVVAGNVIDLTWWIVPTFVPNHFAGVVPVALSSLLSLGALLLMADAFWRRHGVLPKDPRLVPTINGEHLH
jgi:hypothetical protein